MLKSAFSIKKLFLSICFLSVLLWQQGVCIALAPPAPFTIFAASSLTDAMEEIIAAYAVEMGSDQASLSVASSGTLARQIEMGAPANIYISADRKWVDYLVKQGLVETRALTLIANNSLVLVTRDREVISGNLPEQLTRLARNGRIAIGDPDSAPVGRYTKQALESLELWDRLSPSLVPTSNARVALSYVARGQVDAAIVYVTDAALIPELKVQAVLFPNLHDRIEYWAVVLEGAPWTAHTFVEFLSGGHSRIILGKNGFLLP